jgi:hypothetical protein
MTDRQLLEAAAKAAGIAVKWREELNCLCYAGNPYGVAWNPLTDAADALQLMAKMSMDLEIQRQTGSIWASAGYGGVLENPRPDDDWSAAARRCIVRAAAALAPAQEGAA